MSKGGKQGPSSTTTEKSRTNVRIGRDKTTRLAKYGLRGGIAQARNQLDTAGQVRGQGFQGIGTAQQAGGLRGAGIAELQRTIAGQPADQIAGRLEAISAPAIRNLQRSVLPSISSEFAGDAGRGRGSEFAAIADAQEGVAGQIAAQAAQLQEAERGRQFGAAQLFPQVAASDANIANQQIAAGGAPAAELRQAAATLPALRIQESRSRSKTKQSQGKKGKGGSIGTIAGAGIGAAFGGPAGATLGANIGGAAGEASGI